MPPLWRCAARRRSPRVALGFIGLHYADVAFFQPEPGTSAGDHLVSGLVPIGLLAVLGALYPRMRAGARAAWAIFVVLFALVAGLATSGSHVLGEGPAGDDYTGVLAVVAEALWSGSGRSLSGGAGSWTGRSGAMPGVR